MFGVQKGYAERNFPYVPRGCSKEKLGSGMAECSAVTGHVWALPLAQLQGLGWASFTAGVLYILSYQRRGGRAQKGLAGVCTSGHRARLSRTELHAVELWIPMWVPVHAEGRQLKCYTSPRLVSQEVRATHLLLGSSIC